MLPFSSISLAAESGARYFFYSVAAENTFSCSQELPIYFYFRKIHDGNGSDGNITS